MSRDIKFRAWDERAKHMYNDVFCWGTGIKQLKGIVQFITSGQEGVELMQYTAFKDKNGKEIYEGDVVKQYVPARSTAVKRLQVKWDDRDAGFNVSGRGNFEVIGNIYENPELLEKQP